MKTISKRELDSNQLWSIAYKQQNNLTTQEVRGLCVNDVVMHKNGDSYLIVGFCLEESTCEIQVLYRNTSRIWSRPIDKFMDGRFTKIDMEEVE